MYTLEGLENILKAATTAGDAISSRVLAMISDCGGLTNIEELQVCCPFTIFSLFALNILVPFIIYFTLLHSYTHIYYMSIYYLFIYYAMDILQNHENNAIYTRAVKILETYFGAEEDDQADAAPAIGVYMCLYAVI